MDIEELIERIKEGDNVALETLYETYAPMMRNVCVNITNEDEDVVNDLVQMAFIRAYYSIFQLRDASKFGEWVATITKNVALKHLAQKRKEHGLKGVSPFAKLLHLLVNFMDADGSGNTLNPDCIEDEIYKLFNELYPKE